MWGAIQCVSWHYRLLPMQAARVSVSHHASLLPFKVAPPAARATAASGSVAASAMCSPPSCSSQRQLAVRLISTQSRRTGWSSLHQAAAPAATTESCSWIRFGERGVARGKAVRVLPRAFHAWPQPPELTAHALPMTVPDSHHSPLPSFRVASPGTRASAVSCSVVAS